MHLVTRRFLLTIPTMLILLFIVFLLIDLAPGDIADALMTDELTEAARDSIRAEFGLDRSLPIRYLDYVLGLVQGDFGVSARSQLPVLQEIGLRLPNTLLLAAGSLVLSIMMGIVMGIMAATYQNRWPDNLLTLFVAINQALPLFWVALILVIIFAVQLQWVPVFGTGTPSHWVLPIFTTSLALAPGTARLIRTSILEVRNAPHTRVAHAKGLSQKAVFWRHVVPFVAIPVVSYIGLQASFLVSGLIFIEVVFAIPGLGTLALQSVLDQDPLLLLGVTFFIALMTFTILTLTDLAVILLDPRLRSLQR